MRTKYSCKESFRLKNNEEKLLKSIEPFYFVKIIDIYVRKMIIGFKIMFLTSTSYIVYF